MPDLHLVQHVSQPSRITPISSTLIGHIITSTNLTVNLVSQAVGLSYHLIQVLNINNVLLVVKPEKSVMCVCSLCRCDWDAVQEFLRTVSWYVMDIFDDIDDKWHFLKSCLQYVLNQHAPLKQVVSKCSKQPTPWLTHSLLLASKEK